MGVLKQVLERFAFEPGTGERPERFLGWFVLGLVAFAAWLIFWPFIPPLISSIVVWLIDLLVAIWSAIPPLSWPEWLRWPWS
jgi:hypothetical protein